MMVKKDFEAPDKLKSCDLDDDGIFNVKRLTSSEKNILDSNSKKLNYCEEFKFENDNVNVPFSSRLSQISSFQCKRDTPVKMWDTTTMPVKRAFDNKNSLHISVKKSKMVRDDYNDKEDDESKRPLAMKNSRSINREIEECCKELRNKKKQVSFVREIKEIQKEMQGKVERKEKELKALSQKIAECTVELESIKKELQFERKKLLQVISTRQKHIDFEGQVEELKGRMMEFELMKEELESRKKEIDLKEKLVEGRELKQESKENQLENREKEIEIKEQRIEEQEKELKFKKQHIEKRLNELQTKENAFEGRVKLFESEKEKYKVNLRALGMELMFKQKQIYSRTRVVASKEEKHEARVKEHLSKETEFENQMKEFEFKEKNFENQVEDFKSKQMQLEVRWKELDSKENEFKLKVKQQELKEKRFDEQVKEFKSKLDKFDGQQKEPELKGKQYEALKKHIDDEKESGAILRLIVTEVGSDMDDQLSSDIDGTSLQDKSRVESLLNDIFNCMQKSSDPSEHVLHIIQNPNSPLYKNIDKALIMNYSHIYLLELLMLISPNIKPCVREKALKLALDLKANMKDNTENSSAVVSFLLLLSIYGLLPYFNEDEVLELFTFVAQHKIALKMFETLGFANKVSDFVENLIRRKQFVGAVRFSYEYNMACKNQSVDMLRDHVKYAKLICESSCDKTNSVEIKDKARDDEIASLRDVLQCSSDYKILESDDMLKKEIGHRILELKSQKGN